jgi:hypothetical protein
MAVADISPRDRDFSYARGACPIQRRRCNKAPPLAALVRRWCRRKYPASAWRELRPSHQEAVNKVITECLLAIEPPSSRGEAT